MLGWDRAPGPAPNRSWRERRALPGARTAFLGVRISLPGRWFRPSPRTAEVRRAARCSRGGVAAGSPHRRPSPLPTDRGPSPLPTDRRLSPRGSASLVRGAAEACLLSRECCWPFGLKGRLGSSRSRFLRGRAVPVAWKAPLCLVIMLSNAACGLPAALLLP